MGLYTSRGKSSKGSNRGKLYKNEAKQRLFSNSSGPLCSSKDEPAKPLSPFEAKPAKPQNKKSPSLPPAGDPLERLNSDQHDAATLYMGKSLVIASAGTGKTSTIIGRIAFLINNGIKPSEILLLTFTAKAAQEMTERIESLFGHAVACQLRTGTFHSLGLSIAKCHKPDFKLKIGNESSMLFKSIYDSRSFTHINDEKEPLSATGLLEKYSLYLNACDNRYFGDWITKRDESQSIFSDVYSDIVFEFEQLKKKERFYDFNDILRIAKEYYADRGSEFKEVIIDEYQDTNPLQSSVIDAMQPCSLYCVGDYDQSIYAFNGADISIIGNFTEKHKNATVKTLTKNYRSSGSILALAEKVIKNNPRLYPKKLEVMTTNDPRPPRFITPETDAEGVMEICGKIEEATASGASLSEVALIYRSNSSGDVAEIELKQRGIPYSRNGGKSFFNSKDIQFLITAYKLLLGEKTLSLFLYMCEFISISAGVATRIHTALVTIGDGNLIAGIVSPNKTKIKHAFPSIKENTRLGIINHHNIKDKSHLGRMENKRWIDHPVFEIGQLKPSSADMLAYFFDLANTSIDIKRLSPGFAIERLIRSRFTKQAFITFASRYSRDSSGKIAQSLLDKNVASLMYKAEILKTIADKKKNHEALIFFLSTSKKENDSDEEAVSLLTVHASKGLEFDTVFLLDVVDEVFPNIRLMNNGGGGLEEERRLFYVAVTRAKRYLDIYAPKKIKNKNTKPSIFTIEGGLCGQDNT